MFFFLWFDCQANRAANRQHWMANTRTNYRFGQDKIEYSQASKMPDTMGHVGEYRGVLDPNFAQMVRTSAHHLYIKRTSCRGNSF